MRRCLVGLCLLVLLFFWWVVSQPGLVGQLPVMVQANASSSVLGPPTVSAEFINQVLAAYHSPAEGLGQALYNDGIQYGIDPVYALAFFMHESSFGTTGEARKTLSLGNERCLPDRPCVDQDQGGYAQMESWQDGFDHWYGLILHLYIEQWHLTTVEQIIPKYAPSSDGNDVVAYIDVIEQAVTTWRAGEVVV